jgi:hypothetical protein
LILLVVVILAGVGAYFALKKPAAKPATPAPKSSKAQVANMTVKVPSDWQKIDTGLGFSISAPAGWTAGTSTNADVNGLNSTDVVISANNSAPVSGTPDGNTPSNTTAAADSTPDTGTAQSQTSQSVIAGTQKLDSNNGEAAFKERVTHLGSDDQATLKAFGVDTSKITVAAKSIKINGKPWLYVTSNIPNQYSENLYYWDKDHAISLIVTDTTQAKVQQLSKTYLFPMAASLVLDKTTTSQ